MTGKQVKEMAAREGWSLVKFLPFDKLAGLGTNNFKYKYGVNVPLEKVKLSPTETCCSGGLYFTYIHDAMDGNQWTDKYAYWVTVPDDARVIYYEDEKKLKTSQLLIERPWNLKEYKQYLKFRVQWLEYLEQTPELCLAAIRNSSCAMYYIKEQTSELCLAAVRGCGVALRYIQKQTPELCLIAVQCYGYALSNVIHQTPEICLAAVRQNGNALRYVKDPTPEIHRAARQQLGDVSPSEPFTFYPG